VCTFISDEEQIGHAPPALRGEADRVFGADDFSDWLAVENSPNNRTNQI